MTLNRACYLIALVIFVLASLGAWPNVLSDFEPVALGLAFLAGGLLL